ncbi:MAG TPA: helical backbone metal receptor [Gemmatimonadales bacterium]|nr:helical backbone metal receptor [Gemmatimonadales bacterium]
MTGHARSTSLILGCLALLAGCAPAHGAPRQRAAVRGADVPRVVVDDAGDSLRLAAAPARIVSLNPTATELLFALGLGGRVVGRTRWCDFPPAARAVPSVGDGLPPNVEAVLQRQPDLVVIYRSAANDAAVQRLRDLGVPVLALRTDRLEDLSRAARALGAAAGVSAAGDSVAAVLDSTLARRQGQAAGALTTPVVIIASTEPPIAIGAGSYLHEVVELAGGRNLFAEVSTASAAVSLEAIAARNPEAIVAVGEASAAGFARPEWRVVRAVRDGRVIVLSEPALARLTPRASAAIAALRSRLASVTLRRPLP